MYKQPTIPSVRSASRCGPKLFVFALVCPSIRNKARDPSLVLVLLSRGGSMAALKLSRLHAFSRLSLRRDGAPLTHRARQRKPAWAVANTSKYCLQTASNSRPGANVSCRSTVCPLSARPHATATQITKFPPSCARHAHLAGTTVTARRRRAAPPRPRTRGFSHAKRDAYL